MQKQVAKLFWKNAFKTFLIFFISRHDFNKGHVDVFFGDRIRECNGAELIDGSAIMVVSHAGSDAWLGEWIR